MPSEKQLLEVLEKLQVDASGFIAASLVDLDSGMTLAVKSVRPDFDLTAASAYNSELVKQKLKIMRTLGLTGTIEDMMISLTDQIHIVKLIGPSTFLYLAVDKKQSNLAIVRASVNKHVGGLTA
jgi:predicted regulator of Ras-like GTPase activity (Roadblock/LC7/MglB family)